MSAHSLILLKKSGRHPAASAASNRYSVNTVTQQSGELCAACRRYNALKSRLSNAPLARVMAPSMRGLIPNLLPGQEQCWHLSIEPARCLWSLVEEQI